MPVLVATHDGPFHADDVMAFALIRTFLDPEARVVRTRDPARIAAADIVADVGGTYDRATRRFGAGAVGPAASAAVACFTRRLDQPATAPDRGTSRPHR